MTRAKCGGTGGIRTLDTLAGTPDFKTDSRTSKTRRRGARRRQRRSANAARYRKKRRIPQVPSDFWQGPIVYLLRSFGDAAGHNTVERMMLHPRVSTLNTAAARSGRAHTVPHRVVYRYVYAFDPFAESCWRMSCVSRAVDRTHEAGAVIGDGSDAAALAWLLEGERAR